MSKYVIQFSKEGYICFTSHLDMMRLFKRAFKKCGLSILYSQGFNPHPKMSFAQPLSLGYSSVCEFLEFETSQPYAPEDIKERLAKQMPEGIRIFSCQEAEGGKKTLAARTKSAEYVIGIPLQETQLDDVEQLSLNFMAQEEIPVMKKKKKEQVQVNIKGKIQHLNFVVTNQTLLVSAVLDAGSVSNLSPELLTAAILEFLQLEVDRGSIEIMRTKIEFS